MDNFESTFLRWICLFDEFKDNEYSSIKNLVSSTSFKQFVDNVFCLKCSSDLSTEDTQVYNTIKVNYCEFEVQKYEDLYNKENSIYTCVVVLLHALLKCTNDKFRNQLSERMNNEEQELLANFLKATQSLLFTKQNISEALVLISDSKHTSINVSEVYSNNNTPIKSKSMRRSYLQEFCESPKSQCLINQEKEKYITKLTEDYKNECEENYKLAENVKYLKELNTQLSNKLEDKDKILQLLKDEIKEYSKPNQSPENKTDNTLIIKKLNRDKKDLEMNCNELKQQVTELDKKHKELNGKFEMKTSEYNNLILTFDNVESENMMLKENMKLFEATIKAKDLEITSLKDELCNKSITNNPTNISSQEANSMPPNTLFNELSCLKLEEITHDKEKYRHKYKSIKKELSNTEIHVKELNDKIIILEKKLNDYETHKDELIDQFTNKKKELQECQKKKNNLESKIKHLKDTIKDNENHIESLCSKLDKREKQIEMLSVEMDSVKKSKTMIELILSKTNTEIEAIHEEYDEKVKKFQSTIEEYKNSENLSHQNLIDLENNLKNVQDNLANKEHIIIFYEEKMAENYQIIGTQEEQLKTMYQEKLLLESHLKNVKVEIETQQKNFNDKNHEMENYLEYYLDELKDIKNEKTKIEEILHCKKNEIDQQLELINYQKDIIKTLQSEQCSQQLIINDLNEVLQQKSSENKDLSAKVLETTSDLNKLNEKLSVALADNDIIETNLKKNELQMKTLKEEFQCQINDMKNVLENQNNQYIKKVEKLQDNLDKKQNDFNEQLIVCNKLTETISQLQVEKKELEEKLKLSNLDLNQKQIQFEQITKENNKLKQNVDYIENQCLDLQHKLNDLNNIILKKEEDIKLLKVDISENSVLKESLQKQVIEVQQVLNNKNIELEDQIQQYNEQREAIIKLNLEKECLNDKIINLEESLTHNEYKFNLCEGKLYDCSNTVDDLEKKINEIKNEKSFLELELKETITKLSKANQDLTLQLEINETNLLNTQEKLILEQDELKKEIEKSNEQIKTISILNAENVRLEEETNKLQKCLNINDDTIKSLQEKVLACENQYEELQTLKTNLVSELSEKQLKLVNLHQESKQQLDDMNIKYNEVQEKYNNKQIELDEFFTRYNCLMKTVTHLTTERDNLINKTDTLENNLLNKDIIITTNQEKLLEYEEMNNKILTEKTAMEVDLNLRLKEMETKLADLQEELNLMHLSLETREKEIDQHLKTIFSLTSDKDNLINETKTLKDCLLEKEKILSLNDTKFIGFETQLSELQSLKNFLETELNDTKTQLHNIQHNLTQTLEVKNKQLQDVEEKHINLQEELDKQNKKLNENQLKLINLHQESEQQLDDMNIRYNGVQEKCNNKQIELDEFITRFNCLMKTVIHLTTERDNLINKTDMLENTLLNKDIIITTNQEKLLEYEEINNKIITEKTVMEVDLTQRLKEMETKLADLQEELNLMHLSLETREKEIDQHLNTIFSLTSDKDNLISETKALKDCLLEKEKTLSLNDTKLIGFETQLNELQSLKNFLEAELKDTKTQLLNIQHNLTQKLEVTNKQLQDVEEKHINLQEELDKQNKCSIEQIEKINSLMCEKNNLINETNNLKEYLVQNETDLELTQNKLQDYDKQNKEIESRNTSLLIELNQLKCQFNNLHQESTEEIDKINKKKLEAQEQINLKQTEMNEHIKLKNDLIIDIYKKINYLKCMKIEMESMLKKERKNFETCFETCLNYSFNHVNNKPKVDHHDSLIEVITSADTFIEQNGIQLARVENYDEYFIIEKVKKIFEALKMFIISLKSQGNEQTINDTSNESNETYTELLALSKTQQATIKHLENEMSTLKSECNYKMTKVQQKTQEYVTSEYEKKFERKREQMKQFCKDLEAKIHQDYETKLSKYKDKITKDEIHIKELGQQLWEVSEKYLKLQQKDRRESTMSLPFEMSMNSEITTTLPKYNSFTLPKSSSVGQIRSLVEETTRSYQDNTKRNVPAGIGKIFPKEEDEEGEMFNHSCLSDLKQGKVRLSDNKKLYNERLSELQARNSLCPPHLRSCYAVETNFLPNTSLVTEEDIKSTANYSDYETENLIPNDRTKKKDRNQTSYKKPGPPTPSKNGGRVSLSSNQKITLKESKETNTNKRRASSTPNKLFSLFMSKKN
ncbi:putative leucine-rich repeat-containing protein DDB_G0290503 isoform X2 [Melanaphis sacchari]|uniref:putative leucine-rich repeat-containing protein DDB_G0290503 isoform X2 n=1 Tax=Melanaphis sacchari TaxID=742174 RepID=UPI000DC14175|nr:putative leucine-rich repeat-containing protein DDB_G0290503 isoform X2 [Melanaphis sacchari]